MLRDVLTYLALLSLSSSDGPWVQTAVSLYEFSRARDPTRFHEADAWRPERWLPEARQPDSPYHKDQVQSLMPFGYGVAEHPVFLVWSLMKLQRRTHSLSWPGAGVGGAAPDLGTAAVDVRHGGSGQVASLGGPEGVHYLG